MVIEAVYPDQPDRSGTESTRKQALEVVIDFAWESDYVLDLLKKAKITETLQDQEAYVWDYCSPSLQVTSHMVYASVQDGKVFSLLKRYKEDPNDRALMDFIRYESNSVSRPIALKL